MSDVVHPVKKVSREGIVLIKSFEGFRPRAVMRPEGGWIIGYGHTLSAREGATVSEADAELLLRYDLLAVETRLNDTISIPLNQHQFDALASFAFSVGLDRFATSDVLSRLASGEAGAAAEAMLAWPETRSPSAGSRRRAAERALFTADPAHPVALAALLAAPVVEPEMDPQEPEAEPIISGATPMDERQVADRIVEPAPAEIEPRVAAVAVLLGEAETPVGPAIAPIVPTFETFAPAPVDEPMEVVAAAAPASPSEREPPAPKATKTVEPEPANDVEVEFAPEPEPQIAPEPAPALSAATPQPTQPLVGGPVAGGAATSLALNVHRYSPYGAAIIGPIPGLAPVPSPEPEPEPTTVPESLLLTSPDDAPEPVVVRPAWTAEERAEVETTPAGESLFGEDLGLTQGGQPLGQSDFEPEPPQRFDWSETGAFIVMGAVGLTAFGASMAAFRLASEQGAGDETSIIGWVLAVIGVACVGVSSFNLYRKFGLAGSDR